VAVDGERGREARRLYSDSGAMSRVRLSTLAEILEGAWRAGPQTPEWIMARVGLQPPACCRDRLPGHSSDWHAGKQQVHGR
jgi:hypothetical protein